MKRIVILAAALLLSACASGGLVATGNGVYMLTKKAGACGFTNGEESKVALLREANAFCAAKGKEIETLSATANPGVPMVHCASAEVNFRCVSPASPQRGGN